jgi:hypothetical protein
VHITHKDAVAAIPHTYIECTGRGVIVSLMRRTFMRRTLSEPGWNRRTLASGHDAMIIAPQALPTYCLNYLRAKRPASSRPEVRIVWINSTPWTGQIAEHPIVSTTYSRSEPILISI